MGKEAHHTKKWIIGVLVLAASAALYFLLPPELIRETLAGLGPWAPAVYMAMFAVLRWQGLLGKIIKRSNIL